MGTPLGSRILRVFSSSLNTEIPDLSGYVILSKPCHLFVTPFCPRPTDPTPETLRWNHETKETVDLIKQGKSIKINIRES